VFYAGLCIANAGMLPFDELMKMEMTSASLLKLHFGVGAQYAMAIATLLACLTCLNGFWLGSIRLMYSMGKGRILPRWFEKLNDADVPSHSNFAILIIVIVFIAISGTRWLESLFTLMAIGVSIAYLLSSMAFIQLRNKHPEWKRPWMAPGGKLMGYLAVLCSAVMGYYTFKYFDLTLWALFGIYFVVLGGPVWLYLRHRRKQSPEVYVINVPAGMVEEKN
jgi:APA family basic amino acid/polyamine antiporter